MRAVSIKQINQFKSSNTIKKLYIMFVNNLLNQEFLEITSFL